MTSYRILKVNSPVINNDSITQDKIYISQSCSSDGGKWENIGVPQNEFVDAYNLIQNLRYSIMNDGVVWLTNG